MNNHLLSVAVARTETAFAQTEARLGDFKIGQHPPQSRSAVPEVALCSIQTKAN